MDYLKFYFNFAFKIWALNVFFKNVANKIYSTVDAIKMRPDSRKTAMF
jgi:hypothetical protein